MNCKLIINMKRLEIKWYYDELGENYVGMVGNLALFIIGPGCDLGNYNLSYNGVLIDEKDDNNMTIKYIFHYGEYDNIPIKRDKEVYYSDNLDEVKDAAKRFLENNLYKFMEE
jgi:hypothetical protein